MVNDGPLLLARGIRKRFGKLEVLSSAGIEVGPGRIVAVLGENGSGKSTLLRILARRERMDAGEIVHAAPFGYCPQTPELHPYLTPDEHFELFGAAQGMSAGASRARGDELVETFAFARHRARIVTELSGGTRQKLNLALAVFHDPRVLLLDEPYAGFDLETYGRFTDYCRGARSRGCSVVLVTHLVLDPGGFDGLLHLREGVLHAEAS